MKIILKFRALGITLSLLLLCSCATTYEQSTIVPATELPADVTINKSAGRGDLLYVTLRLDGGEELLFVVDTGCERTILDKTLESKLGKRLGETTLITLYGKWQVNLFAAPSLYLGNTRLVTGNEVETFDFKGAFPGIGRPIMGILGMDCLKHYCIQLDFEAGKMRFLNSGQIDTTKLGNIFLLNFKSQLSFKGRNQGDCPFINHAGLAGGKDTDLLIDSGSVLDGQIERGKLKWNQYEGELVQKIVWDSKTYTNLCVSLGANVVGLRFLARHLVTFDFPQRTMYLKQTSVGPLVDEDVESAAQFVSDMKRKGQLPGWSKDEKESTAYPLVNSNSLTFNIEKKNDSSLYHYTVSRAFKDDSWKLQRAWRTDQNDKLVEEYSAP